MCGEVLKPTGSHRARKRTRNGMGGVGRRKPQKASISSPPEDDLEFTFLSYCFLEIYWAEINVK